MEQPSSTILGCSSQRSRTIWSIYGQDEWELNEKLRITAGIRAQFYDGDAPKENPNFVARYGFSNAVGFDAIDPVILPRLGFTYDMLDDGGMFSNTTFTGAVGLPSV